MTDTRTVPVADLLESLDFDACCTFGHKPQSEYEPCDSPAIWVTVAHPWGTAGSPVSEGHRWGDR